MCPTPLPSRYTLPLTHPPPPSSKLALLNLLLCTLWLHAHFLGRFGPELSVQSVPGSHGGRTWSGGRRVRSPTLFTAQDSSQYLLTYWHTLVLIILPLKTYCAREMRCKNRLPIPHPEVCCLELFRGRGGGGGCVLWLRQNQGKLMWRRRLALLLLCWAWIVHRHIRTKHSLTSSIQEYTFRLKEFNKF